MLFYSRRDTANFRNREVRTNPRKARVECNYTCSIFKLTRERSVRQRRLETAGTHTQNAPNCVL